MLEGKTVLLPDPSMLSFFYPNFTNSRTLNEWTIGKNIIYTGRYSPTLQSDLRMFTKSYICLCGTPDIILNSEIDWVHLAYSKHGRKTPKYVMETFDLLESNDIWYAIKVVWVTGKWPIKAIPNEKMFTLFQASTISFMEVIKQYYILLEEYPLPYIESSFLTFLLKVKQAQELTTDQVSPQYLQVLRNTNVRVRGKLDRAIDIYFTQQGRGVYFLQLLFNLFQ